MSPDRRLRTFGNPAGLPDRAKSTTPHGVESSQSPGQAFPLDIGPTRHLSVNDQAPSSKSRQGDRTAAPIGVTHRAEMYVREAVLSRSSGPGLRLATASRGDCHPSHGAVAASTSSAAAATNLRRSLPTPRPEGYAAERPPLGAREYGLRQERRRRSLTTFAEAIMRVGNVRMVPEEDRDTEAH